MDLCAGICLSEETGQSEDQSDEDENEDRAAVAIEFAFSAFCAAPTFETAACVLLSGLRVKRTRLGVGRFTRRLSGHEAGEGGERTEKLTTQRNNVAEERVSRDAGSGEAVERATRPRLAVMTATPLKLHPLCNRRAQWFASSPACLDSSARCAPRRFG